MPLIFLLVQLVLLCVLLCWWLVGMPLWLWLHPAFSDHHHGTNELHRHHHSVLRGPLHRLQHQEEQYESLPLVAVQLLVLLNLDQQDDSHALVLHHDLVLPTRPIVRPLSLLIHPQLQNFPTPLSSINE
jgi:hypothetical protein